MLAQISRPSSSQERKAVSWTGMPVWVPKVTLDHSRLNLPWRSVTGIVSQWFKRCLPQPRFSTLLPVSLFFLLSFSSFCYNLSNNYYSGLLCARIFATGEQSQALSLASSRLQSCGHTRDHAVDCCVISAMKETYTQRCEFITKPSLPHSVKCRLWTN